jgi:hypothetical protein
MSITSWPSYFTVNLNELAIKYITNSIGPSAAWRLPPITTQILKTKHRSCLRVPMNSQSLSDIGLSYFDEMRTRRNIPLEYICQWNQNHFRRFGVYSVEDQALLLSLASEPEVTLPHDSTCITITGPLARPNGTANQFLSMVDHVQEELKSLCGSLDAIKLVSGGASWSGNVVVSPFYAVVFVCLFLLVVV